MKKEELFRLSHNSADVQEGVKNMTLTPITAKQANYIKLGRKGKWEKDCIEVSQTLRLGYNDVADDLCRKGEWDKVQEELLRKHDVGVATRHKNQIRKFYEADDSVLWTTFFGDRLYWCFSKPEITLLEDGSKIRPVIDKWHSNDIDDKPLQKTELSGKLLAMQGFSGTICDVKEIEYLVKKINGVVPSEIEDALKAKAELYKKIETLICSLNWKDFELLVDMLFRQAGWQRVATLGKTEKTIDLHLYSPISDETFLVQVKSKAGRAELQDFQKRIAEFQSYSRAYFIVHTPKDDLVKIKASSIQESEDLEDVDVKVWLLDDIAQRIVMYGLADWVIGKAKV